MRVCAREPPKPTHQTKPETTTTPLPNPNTKSPVPYLGVVRNVLPAERGGALRQVDVRDEVGVALVEVDGAVVELYVFRLFLFFWFGGGFVRGGEFVVVEARDRTYMHISHVGRWRLEYTRDIKPLPHTDTHLVKRLVRLDRLQQLPRPFLHHPIHVGGDGPDVDARGGRAPGEGGPMSVVCGYACVCAYLYR